MGSPSADGEMNWKSKRPLASVMCVVPATSTQMSPGRFMFHCTCTARRPEAPMLPVNLTTEPPTTGAEDTLSVPARADVLAAFAGGGQAHGEQCEQGRQCQQGRAGGHHLMVR